MNTNTMDKDRELEEVVSFLKEFYSDEVIDAGVDVLSMVTDDPAEIIEALKLSFKYEDLIYK